MANRTDQRINIIEMKLGLNDGEFKKGLTGAVGQAETYSKNIQEKIRATTRVLTGFEELFKQTNLNMEKIIQQSVHKSYNDIELLLQELATALNQTAQFSNVKFSLAKGGKITAQQPVTPAAYRDIALTGQTNIANGKLSEKIDIEYGELIKSAFAQANSVLKNLSVEKAIKATDVSNMGIDQMGEDASKRAEMVYQVTEKARKKLGITQTQLDSFMNAYGDYIISLKDSFDKQGRLKGLEAQLRIAKNKTLSLNLTSKNIDTHTDVGDITMLSRKNRQYIKETFTDDEIAQQEQYKKLLTQEYDLQLKIDQAQREGNEQQVIELKRQQELVRLKKQELNDYRATQIGEGKTVGRDAFTDTTGDITNKDSIAYLNQQLQLRNQNINKINEQAHTEQQTLSQRVQKEQELVRLLQEENKIKSQLSLTDARSVQEANLNRRLSNIATKKEGYRSILGDETYNRISSQTVSTSAEEENTINKLITLENQRLDAWNKSRSAIRKGNQEEAIEYQNIARDSATRYNQLLNQANANNILTQSSRDFLKVLTQSSEAEQRLVLSRENDIDKMKQQSQRYNEISSGLNKYVALLKEKSKLESTKDTSGSGVYANAYANVNAQISQLTTNFSKLIDIQSNGTLQLKAWSNDLGITKEQYDNLNTSIQTTNQTITNNAIQAKQEQDLQMINKMVEAYTRLKTAQIQLQQAKDRNYNDAEIARRTREVQLAEEHFNKLKQENSELAKSETYRNAIANADNKMATSISYTNQNMTQQLTLLQRLRNNLQRTAAVAFNFNIFNRIFMELRQGISDVIQKVQDFDKAMTDIQMVTGKTDSSVKQLLADYSEIAKELGTTTKNVAEGSIEWFCNKTM